MVHSDKSPNKDKSSQEALDKKTPLKKKIIRFLPPAIERVIQTYHDFSDQAMSFDAKEFGQYHSACKAAIAHLESLLKLLKNQNEDTEKASPSAQQKFDPVNISALLRDAKKELDDYEES